ncbi:histo-blood group ABO system transferase isoform X3 [Vulpes lagopus]|uniref:histo-blood group ABO system transferase isoform X3 n=1 Tax=Vulpes lagopus TaxID=494514 RepID=UPI001BC99594|nr:histo-blood group ABO system transferase isoform X3 [Vulpes lagopus]
MCPLWVPAPQHSSKYTCSELLPGTALCPAAPPQGPGGQGSGFHVHLLRPRTWHCLFTLSSVALCWGLGHCAISCRGFWGKSASPWLCGFLLFAACLGFYSNIFNLIPGWGQRRESESQEAGPVVPQRMLETRQCRMLYPNVQLLNPMRADVLVLTPWFAPIVWEGVFDSAILDAQFRNTTIGLTVFAIKKYVVFLELFLQTAEKHFMVGHRVIYYVFTDRPADVPRVPLAEGRQVVVLEVRNYARWQEVSMHRMEMISNFSQQRFLHEVDYLVCMDVDMKFCDHMGVEILSPLFGTLHPGFYGAAREAFTYERRLQSQAYIPRDEGDFYYAGGFFGGSVVKVLQLTTACHQAMVVDQANRLEAMWHDESHLNRYLLDHKPTKVLSPEYLWDRQKLGWPPVMKKLRFVAVPKGRLDIRGS